MVIKDRPIDLFRKLVISIFGICISVILSILTLIKGWGLHPQSWWWIIGVGIFGQIITAILITVSNKDN